DSSATAPAFAQADRSFVVPPVDHADYIESLWTICRECRVRLVIPILDLELPRLSQQAPRFHAIETIPVVSAPGVVALCQDKWAASQFLNRCGIATPRTYPTYADVRAALAQGLVRYPLIVKPRWGVSSIGVERVDNDRELELAAEWAQFQLRR